MRLKAISYGITAMSYLPTGPLILAIDVGSSSVRALVFDAQGSPLLHTGAREHHSFRTAPDGSAEDDPASLLAKLERCIDATLHQAGPLAQEIAAVAIDTYVSSLLGTDNADRPVTPVYTYADTRSARQSIVLQQQLNEVEVLDRTGCLLRTAYHPARLRWLYTERPDLTRPVRRWISVGEWLELQLFGNCRASFSVASWSGLLDRHTLTWDTPLLDAIGADAEMLSPLCDAADPLQGLRPSYAARWPTLAHIPWYPAIGDGAAANLGSGCAAPNRVALTIGTTGAARVVAPNVGRVPWGLWCYRVDARRSLLGGATSEGGNLFAWLNDTLRLGDSAAIERALDASPPDGHGLTVLPFVAGERSPGYAGDVRATISGIGLSTTADDIVRACLEAISYRLALVADLLDEALPSERTVVASGGALLSSPAWMQLLADVLGHPVVAATEREATCRGTALLALESLGALPDLSSAPTGIGPAYQPDPARHAIYQAGLQRHQDLYHRIITG